jgi:tRNA-specific 2-thiouridylase
VLLKAQGHEVLGIFMRTGASSEDAERRAKTCCSAADAHDAQNVADRLDIPFYALDYERDFARIKDYFSDEYLAGRTPNPCVVCNIWLKFGRLWAHGKQVGADFVATGHYARVVKADDGSSHIARAIDRGKDQSYVLFGLPRELLPHVLFPVGGFTKPEIRAIAREHGLPVHNKPDSQEICFVPGDDYLAFVRDRRPDRATTGSIVDEDGSVLGQHAGIEAFTIGQRRGLGIVVGAPRYVVAIEPLTRTVTVGRRESLEKFGLIASRFNWQSDRPERPIPCLAQIRAQHRAVPAMVTALAGERARVVFQTPQSAISPGQVVTIYHEDLVLGGGWIDKPIDDGAGDS